MGVRFPQRAPIETPLCEVVFLFAKGYTEEVKHNFISMHDVSTKHVKAVSFLMLGVAALAFVYQYGSSIERTYPNRTFNVQGQAKIETPHDLASFTATVTTEGGVDTGALQVQNTEKMNAINAFLVEKGIDTKDLKTTNYSMNPRYSYGTCTQGNCPPPSITGYAITQSLEVKVRDTSKTGELLSGIVGAGANSVSGVNFVTDDDSDARQNARIAALEDAHKKALDLAKAGNFRIGKMVTFYEDSPVSPQPYAVGGEMMDVASAKVSQAPTPVVQPGTEEGMLTMTVTYEMR